MSDYGQRGLYRLSGALGGPWAVALAAGVILTSREVQRRWAADIWEAQASGVYVGEQRARGLLGDTERDRRLRAATKTSGAVLTTSIPASVVS